MSGFKDSFEVFRAFKKPKAKFDFVKLVMPRDMSLIMKLNDLKVATGARFKVPLSRRFKSITLHDPTCDELNYLVNNFPDMEIEELEVAIDFYPLTQSGDLKLQSDLYRWLKKRLYPRQHPLLRSGCLRYNWCNERCKRMRDRTLKMNGNGTYYYYSKNKHFFVRLYVKEFDQRKRLSNVPVRIEVHLDRGGCQDFEVHRLALFPDFIDRMRSELSPLFTIAKGIKHSKPRFRAKTDERVKAHEERLSQHFNRVDQGWREYGAAFADFNDLLISPDREWKCKVGEALQGLRNKYRSIPQAMAEKVEHFKSLYSVKSTPSIGF